MFGTRLIVSGELGFSFYFLVECERIDWIDLLNFFIFLAMTFKSVADRKIVIEGRFF